MTRSTLQDDPTLLVHAYLDGELDPINALAVEQRLASDAVLAAEYERVQALQQVIRARLPREVPPPGLRARVEAAVRPQPRWRPAGQPSWRALAASILVTAFVASGSTWMALAPRPAEEVGGAIVAGHIRSLMAPQPIDIASSDRHTVKPWFNGRIPQAPRVVDLAKDDFPLVGGRLDVVGRIPVPTLVYRHAKHLISLTAVPASGSANSPLVVHRVEGYNVLRWIDDGVAYWAISDMSAADLDRFAQLFRTASSDQ
ncbi:MAG: anti-sigma factor family protein [Xanthobacteraceae bacterium]